MSGLPATSRRIGLTLAVGGLLATLDTTVTVLALPTIIADLSTSLPLAQWITIGYLLAMVAVIPLTGRLVSRFGDRQVYLTALSIFTFGTLACGFAPGIEFLIGARVLQGLGAGLLNPAGQAIALRSTPTGSRGAVLALLALPVAIGPVLGPPLAGLVIGAASWRWVFWALVPVAAAAIAASVRVLPRPGRAAGGAARLDLIQAIGFPAGSALLVIALTALEAGAGPDLRAVGLGAAGTALLAWAANRARTAVSPIVDVRLGTRRMLTGLAVLLFFGIAYFGTMSVLPLYIQGVRGESATTAGLLQAPAALAAGLTIQVSGRLADRFPVWRIVSAGLAVALVGAAGLGAAAWTGGAYPVIAGWGVVLGVGAGLTIVPAMTATMRPLEGDEVPAGTTVMALTQQFGAAAGNAVVALTVAAALGALDGPVGRGGAEALMSLDPAARAALRPDSDHAVAVGYVVALAGSAAALGIAALRGARRRTPAKTAPGTDETESNAADGVPRPSP